MARFSALALVAAAAGAALLVAALWALYPFPRPAAAEATRGGSALILDKDGRAVAWRVDSRDSWRLTVGVKEVSPHLVAATLAAEDKRFFSHPGVDPIAIARALAQNVLSGRRVSGASTITMQTVRLLWPRPRTYAAKAVEAFRALQLESVSDKAGILELYLSLAPYGGNTVGAEAAARRYFGKSASELSLGEAALLAGLPQSPSRRNPERHLDAALRRRDYVLARMVELGMVGRPEAERAAASPVRLLPPRSLAGAERFADWMVQRLGEDCGVVRTTLDPAVQSAACSAAGRLAGEMHGLGIDGVAVVVIDVPRSELAAMVGSADPGDPLVGGINASCSPRQPGSLLKPFIYARAYDSGTLTPGSVVYDVPTSWRDYRPENFDHEHLGPMTAAAALCRSRNVPAVRILGLLGPEELERDMSALGLPAAGAASRCGLSLALGTAELSLVDIANAYAAVARMGEWRELRVTLRQGEPSRRRAYSPAAAYLALRSLPCDEEPPPAPGRGGRGGRAGSPVWKTGTSWNRRDAWAVAMTPTHVVAVWCGRLSGTEHPALVGSRAALPTALELARALDRGERWERPQEVRVRQVCALSGAVPSPACESLVEGEYIPGVSSEVPCALHRFSEEGGRRGSVVLWPPDVAAYMASLDAARGVEAPGGEASSAGGGRVLMVSPRAGGEYVLVPKEAGPARELDRLPLVAQTPAGTKVIYWFLDGELLASSPPDGRVEWTMECGSHVMVASCDTGTTAVARFRVLRPPGVAARAGQ